MKALEREPDDRLLIEAAQRERSNFSELCERNFHRIYAFLFRRVGTREEAQDLTAEVFHQALASLGNFRWQGTPFLSWLYGIAANVLASHWQKLGRNPEQLAEDWDQGGADEIERRAMLAEQNPIGPLGELPLWLHPPADLSRALPGRQVRLSRFGKENFP